MPRNVFIDPATGDSYTWEVNDSEVETSVRSRAMSYAQPVAAGWQPASPIRQQGNGGPHVRRFSGLVATRSQHEAFLRFWKISGQRTIHLVLYTGETVEAIVRSYTPGRRRLISGPRGARRYVWRYTMEIEILSPLETVYVGPQPTWGGALGLGGGGTGIVPPEGEPPVVEPDPPGEEGQAPPDGVYTNLVLDEQFSGSSVDTTRWNMYNSPGHAGNGRRDPAAFSVVGGQLVVTAWWDGANIRSGGMSHRNNYRYGRFEVRIRTEFDPTGQMSGLALTWPQSENWPYDGELDWYETGNNLNPNRNPFYSYLHHYRASVGWDQTRFVHNANGTDWHVMTMDWSPSSIKVYRDGALVNQLLDVAKIPAVPHHMCLQLDAFDNNPLAGPVHMYVDYARIWI